MKKLLPFLLTIAVITIVGIAYSRDNTELTDWKLHRNDPLGLSFRYPAEWYVKDSVTKISGNIDIATHPYPYIEVSNAYEERAPLHFIKIQVQPHEKPASESLVDIASRPSELDGSIAKVESVTIAGIDGYKAIGEPTLDAVYYLPLSTTEYLVILVSSNSEQSRKLAERISLTILETFTLTKI